MLVIGWSRNIRTYAAIKTVLFYPVICEQFGVSGLLLRIAPLIGHRWHLRLRPINMAAYNKITA